MSPGGYSLDSLSDQVPIFWRAESVLCGRCDWERALWGIKAISLDIRLHTLRCNSFVFQGMVIYTSVGVMPAISWVGTLAHLINDFSWDFFYFWLLLKAFVIISFFPLSSFFDSISIFINFLFFSFSSEFKRGTWGCHHNHLVFNWVLIKIYGLRLHLSLRISGRVMKVYIILTPSPKLKYYGLGQITYQHYDNVQCQNWTDRFFKWYRQL